MNRLAVCTIAVALSLAGCAGQRTYLNTSSTSGLHVRLEGGLGPSAWSVGMDDFGQQAAKLPGVTRVDVYDWYQSQTVIGDINAEPPTVRQFVGGYSCGANNTPNVIANLKVHASAAVIQASDWCGQTTLGSNVDAFQETYNTNFIETFGLGAYQIPAGAGFAGTATYINRPDAHLSAATDPDAQADVLIAIKRATLASSRLHGRRSPVISRIVRYHGQPIY